MREREREDVPRDPIYNDPTIFSLSNLFRSRTSNFQFCSRSKEKFDPILLISFPQKVNRQLSLLFTNRIKPHDDKGNSPQN